MNITTKKTALVIPEEANRDNLAEAFSILVEKGFVSAENVNETLAGFVQETHAAVGTVYGDKAPDDQLPESSSSVLEKLKAHSEALNNLEKILPTLKLRFKTHMYRHQGVEWSQVEKRLAEASTEKLLALSKMEETGGEPDVVEVDQQSGAFIFEDRSAASPKGRRSCVYDSVIEKWLIEVSPMETFNGNAKDLAESWGATILNKSQYQKAQEIEYQNGFRMDENTQSWVDTPVEIRAQRGALCGCRNNENSEVIRFRDDGYNKDRGFRVRLII